MCQCKVVNVKLSSVVGNGRLDIRVHTTMLYVLYLHIREDTALRLT